MVGYGERIRLARRPGWEDAYLDYDGLKSVLEEIERISLNMQRWDASPLTGPGTPKHDIETAVSVADMKVQDLAERFLRLLRSEVEKVSLFALARTGQLADAVGALRFASFAGATGPEEQESRNDNSGDESSVTSGSTGNESSFASLALHGYGGVFLSEPNSLAGSREDEDERKPLLLRTPNTSKKENRASFTRTRSLQNGRQSPLFSNVQIRIDYRSEIDQFVKVGIEVLHIIRFVCVNVVACRKVLKKHDKILSSWYNNDSLAISGIKDTTANSSPPVREIGTHRRSRTLPDASSSQDLVAVSVAEPIAARFVTKANSTNLEIDHRLLGNADTHLQQLANCRSVEVICASLAAALCEAECSAAEEAAEVAFASPPDSSRSRVDTQSLLRLRCVVSSIAALRDAAGVTNATFDAFLTRRAMTQSGSDLGGLDGASKAALEFLLRYRPDSAMYLDARALREWTGFDSKGHASPRLNAAGGVELNLEEDGMITQKELFLNLVSTILYTSNYYIIAPTANHYAGILGQNMSYGATLVGVSSLAAVFAALFYSSWCCSHTFVSALVLSALCPLLGNLLYSYAITPRSIHLALWGRVLVGLGAAEVVNRQLITACVPFRKMTRQSALFVAAGALGMSVGPLLAAVLDSVAGRDTDIDFHVPLLGGIIVNHVTSPGFLMAFLWSLQLAGLFLLFKEPTRINSSNESNSLMGAGAKVEQQSDCRNGGAIASLQCTTTDKATTPLKAVSWKSISSDLAKIRKLILQNTALPVTLALFAFIELVDEVLISSCSMVVHRYFGWHGSMAGLLISCLGAFVLPADFLVERAEHFYEDRRIIRHTLAFIAFTAVAIINYNAFVEDAVRLDNALSDETYPIHSKHYYNWGFGVPIYVASLSAMFLGTIVLEGVVMSLMSKVTPPKLNDTFLNCGLLATLIGTIGRVVGDSLTTITGLMDRHIVDFVNGTFLPVLAMTIACHSMVKRTYHSLRN